MVLTQDEGNWMVHELASLDRVESSPWYNHLYQDWEGSTDKVFIDLSSTDSDSSFLNGS